MSLSAAVIDALIAAGVSTEQLGAAMKADLAEREERLRAKRTKDAARQRKSRASRDVTVTRCDSTDASPYEDTSTPLSSETQVSSDGERAGARENPFPRPDWADRGHWRDFMANRKRRRMTNSPTAYSQFLSDAERLADDEWPPGRLLELAAGKGWGSLNKPDENRNGRTHGNRMAGPRPDPTLALVRSAVQAQREDGGDRWQAGAPLPAGQRGGP